MAAARRGGAACTIERDGDGVAALGSAYAFGIEAHVNVLSFQYLANRLRNVLVLTPDQTRSHLDYRDFAAKTQLHLYEFESDIASDNDHQMFRKEIDIHHGAIREVLDLIETSHRWNGRPGTDIYENLLGAHNLIADAD